MSAPADDDPRVPFVILAAGIFPPGRVETRYLDQPRRTTDELERLIAEEWERRTQMARGTGQLLFNGPLLRYVDHAAAPDVDGSPRFRLTVGPTCYRDFVGTNLYNSRRVAEFGWERFSNPVGTTATLLSADGRICYGRRSQRVGFHAGFVHTFGGSLEGQDRAADGSIDPFAALARELAEELALRPDELQDLHCVGLIRDREILQPELLFEADITLTFDQLVRRWEAAEHREEHDALVQLPDQPAAVVPFIRGCGPIAPVAVGALFLHGLHRWGEGWYAAAAEDLHRRGAEDTEI